MSKKRIQPGYWHEPEGHIVAGKMPQIAKTLSFSFKHLDHGNSKFAFVNQTGEYFCKVLERMKNLCSLTQDELLTNRSSSLRAHPIDWENTSEKCGFFNLNEQFKSFRPYQFAISANEHGRVHGFVTNDVFYIVWLDPGHKLYR